MNRNFYSALKYIHIKLLQAEINGDLGLLLQNS